MTRLSANTDRSTKLATIRSARNVVTIASPPSSGGSSAATSERKNSSESRKMNGNASSSACARSWPTCVLAWALAIAPPPSLTSGWPANRRLDLLRVVLQPLVGQRLEVREHVGLPAVARDHRRVVGVVRMLTTLATSARPAARGSPARRAVARRPSSNVRRERDERDDARRRAGARPRPGSGSSPGPTGSRGRWRRTG